MFSNVTPDHYIHLLRPKNQVVILLQYCCHCQMWRPQEVSIPATMYPFLFNNTTIIVCHIYIYYHYYFFQVSVFTESFQSRRIHSGRILEFFLNSITNILSHTFSVTFSDCHYHCHTATLSVSHAFHPTSSVHSSSIVINTFIDIFYPF